jgi:hypothetical protein
MPLGKKSAETTQSQRIHPPVYKVALLSDLWTQIEKDKVYELPQ